MSRFKDHFSGNSADYARARPDYPDALHDWLAGLAPRQGLAWDCGCGAGQAALGLAERFERVIATDASADQIEAATPHPRVAYAVAPAEASAIASGSVDLIVIAQALHWFDHDRFYAEARRVAAPGCVLAAVTYTNVR
jgi:SAM-dependent methyltransferase